MTLVIRVTRTESTNKVRRPGKNQQRISSNFSGTLVVDTHRYQHDTIQNLNDHNDNDDLEGDEFGDLQGANDSDNDEVPSGARQKAKKLA
jgi:hypothetical protein